MMTFNHGLSGYVCAQVAMPLLRKRSPLKPAAMGWAFFLGAMLPDADILVRVLLGRGAYFSEAWYGHRALTHSILGTLLIALAVSALLYRPLAGRAAPAPRRAYGWLVGCFWAGGLLHLVGDVFTPRWPIPIFWPLAERFGALRHIGWFSPYLSVLFLGAIGLGWLLALAARRAPRLHPWAPLAAWGVQALAAARWLDYLLRSRYEGPAQWQAYQESLLPEVLVAPVTRVVSIVWYWFTG